MQHAGCTPGSYVEHSVARVVGQLGVGPQAVADGLHPRAPQNQPCSLTYLLLFMMRNGCPCDTLLALCSTEQRAMKHSQRQPACLQQGCKGPVGPTCGLKWAMLSTIWLAAASSRMAPGSWPSVANALRTQVAWLRLLDSQSGERDKGVNPHSQSSQVFQPHELPHRLMKPLQLLTQLHSSSHTPRWYYPLADPNLQKKLTSSSLGNRIN